MFNGFPRYVPGYEGRYIVNQKGQIYSIPRRGTKGGYLRQLPNGQGHLRVTLTDRHGNQSTKNVHTLVLTTFVGDRPDGMQACHNNGDKTDNRLENLRWDTPPLQTI